MARVEKTCSLPLGSKIRVAATPKEYEMFSQWIWEVPRRGAKQLLFMRAMKTLFYIGKIKQPDCTL